MKTTESASTALPFIPERWLFHPLTRILIAFACAGIFVLGVLGFASGERQQFYLYYYTPIGIPAVLFGLDRLERWLKRPAPQRWTGWWLDGTIVGLALLRSVVLVPGYSGHALFLGYALLTSATWLTRLAAGLVLLQVAYLKIWVWGDSTIYGGLALSIAAAWLWGRIHKG